MIEKSKFFIKKEISPKYLFHYATIAYVAGLMMISVFLAMIVRSSQIVPIVLLSIFFIVIVILNLIHFNRQIYIWVIEDKQLYCASYFAEFIVPLKSVSGLKQIWANMFTIKINDKRYFFSSFKKNVEYLRELSKQDA